MSERFVVYYNKDLPQKVRDNGFDYLTDSYEDFWCLVDTEENAVVGDDFGEIEDKILLRDFSWITDYLNDNMPSLWKKSPIDDIPDDMPEFVYYKVKGFNVNVARKESLKLIMKTHKSYGKRFYLWKSIPDCNAPEDE